MGSLKHKADQLKETAADLRTMASDISNPEMFKDIDSIIYDIHLLELKMRKEVNEVINSIINEAEKLKHTTT